MVNNLKICFFEFKKSFLRIMPTNITSNVYIAYKIENNQSNEMDYLFARYFPLNFK